MLISASSYVGRTAWYVFTMRMLMPVVVVSVVVVSGCATACCCSRTILVDNGAPLQPLKV